MKKIVLIVIAFLALVKISEAQIVYVNGAATGSNDGSSWANAYTDLQVALNAASPSDELWIAAGTYTQNTTNRDSAFQWTAYWLSLYGGFAGTETSLSERDIDANKTILSGDIGVKGDASDNLTTVLLGFNPGSGDAIPKSGDSTWIDGITIQDGNASDFSDLSDNPAYQGGAYVFSENSRYVKFTNCTFTENQSEGKGGALYLTDHNQYAYINFYNCKFTKNSAGRASVADIKGRYLGGLNVFFVNCLITDNEATETNNRYASVFYFAADGSTVRTNLYIHGCTIAGNKDASMDQPPSTPLIGVDKYDYAHQVKLEVVNSILYDNQAPHTYRKLNTWDPTTTQFHNCILESRDLPLNNFTESDITSVDPKFVGGTTDRKYAPGEGSPALNAAKVTLNTNITALQTDADIFGTVRVADSTELGAIEYVKVEPIKTNVKRLNITTATVYPNPAANTISIKGINGTAQVSILNTLGAEVLRTSSTQNIDVSSLPAGLYTLITTQDDIISQAKFMKN